MFQGPAPDWSGWVAIGCLGVFQLGLSYILYAATFKEVTALEGILIPMLEPVLNPVWVGLIILTAVTVRCIGGVLPRRS
jgi:drug/metabolite transporter (DMT)-like permease